MSIPERKGIYQVPENPELSDLLRIHKRNIMLQLRTSTIARVISFNPGTQTVELTVENPPVALDPLRPNAAPLPQPPIVLKNIPVAFPVSGPSAAPSYFTVPIKPGDTGELIIQDRDPNNWLKSGLVADPVNRATHNLAYGVFHPGVRPQAERITNYDIVATVVEGPEIKVGRMATLAAARQTDKTSADTSMQIWIGQSTTLLTALAGLLGQPAPVLPTDFGFISQGSQKVKVE